MTQERRKNGATMAQPKGSEGRLAPLRHSPGLKARGNGENERRSLPPRGQNGAENGAGMAQGTAHDPIIRELQAMLEARSAVGLAKYGTTLAGNPGDLRYWLQHALEETLDHAGYLLRAIREIEARP